MALYLTIRATSKIGGMNNLLSLSTKTARITQLCPEYTTLMAKPPGLQIINSPIKFRNLYLTPIRKSAHSDHSKLWVFEKSLAASLLAIIPATFMFPCGLLDNLFAIAITLHSHMGLEAVCVDYVRPIIFGATIPKLAIASCYALHFFILGSLLYFNYNDVGIAKAVRAFWALKAYKQ